MKHYNDYIYHISMIQFIKLIPNSITVIRGYKYHLIYFLLLSHFYLHILLENSINHSNSYYENNEEEVVIPNYIFIYFCLHFNNSNWFKTKLNNPQIIYSFTILNSSSKYIYALQTYLRISSLLLITLITEIRVFHLNLTSEQRYWCSIGYTLIKLIFNLIYSPNYILKYHLLFSKFSPQVSFNIFPYEFIPPWTKKYFPTH